MEHHVCPSCKTSLKGQYIPDIAINKGFYPETCVTCGDRNHWLNLWVLERHDSLYEVMCQKCGYVCFMSGEHVDRNNERLI